MRYKSQGEVHKDFHGLTCATLHYLLDNYGWETVSEILAGTAKNVYRTMHEALKRGDCSELAEFLEYYLTREGGKFSLERLANGLRLTVTECPALRHLVKLDQSPDPIMCDATRVFDAALVDGSSYVSVLKKTGDFSCVREFLKKGGCA